MTSALLLTLLLQAPAAGFEAIEFPSADGLTLTADLYAPHAETHPFVVLLHQASWSRGEYREIAPRLNELGFNCLAVDLRSGKGVNGVDNEVARRAHQAGKSMAFPDSLPDVVAALEYARKEHARGKLLAWGSSFSASLALKLAGDRPELVDGVIAFAPGEYFTRFGQPADWITASAKNVRCPVFVTSARREQADWQALYDAIPSTAKSSYVPETEGNHGSRALWKKFEDSPGYWRAVETFLAGFRAPAAPAATGG